MTVQGDNKAAEEFLLKWAPSGPWVLTSIRPDKKGIVTATFYPSNIEDLRAWLVKFNSKSNIYFHVNSPMRDLTKKANREDIKSVDWFHVDIDPRAGEDLEDERKRALELLTTNLPKDVPAPTVVVFSGGGYQGFWKLETPIEIEGDLPKAEDAKRYNVQLEIRFGADNCHNIDRIMRLPGTVNLPDARKISKGRTPTLAKVVKFDDSEYPLKDFMSAQAVQMAKEGTFGAGASQIVTISGNINRLSTVEELNEWDVPDRVKIIMAQGEHPEQPKDGDNSRSAWLFDFVCHMVRAEVPDDIIFSIITDPGWEISSSVLELKGNAERYAIKQIESAKFHSIEPWLNRLNTEFAVVQNYGGKCLIISDVYDHSLKRNRLTRQTFGTFKEAFLNKQVKVGANKNGDIFMPLGKWWVEHPHRRQYSAIAFAPECTLPDDIYNLWRGFAYTADPDEGGCDLFLKHVHDNICAGNDQYYEYLIKWMARATQFPDQSGKVAIVMRGGRGTGKSFFARTFGQLFARHYMAISNSGHLVGNFNSHLRDLVVLFADEAFFAGDKKHESILKTLVTEEQMAIEAKGVDVEMAPNCIHLIMASNDLHVIPAGGDERRFFVVDVGEDSKQNNSYFRAIAQQMEENKGAGYRALLHFLRTMDLQGFEVEVVPNTEALREQKLLSLSSVEEWWYQKLLSGTTLTRGDGWVAKLPVEHLVTDYTSEMKRFNISKRGNATAMGRFLNQVCPEIRVSSRKHEFEIQEDNGWTRHETRRTRWYILPPLDKSRESWEKNYGKTDWDEVEEE